MRKVVVDFLNISLVLKLIKNEQGSHVVSLFDNRSALLGFFLINILRLFRITHSLDQMDFDKLPLNPTVEISKNAETISKSIVNKYKRKTKSQVSNFINYSVRAWMKKVLWRPVSVVEYSNYLYSDACAIYVSSPINKKILNKSTLSKYQSFKPRLIYYAPIGLINDNGYVFRVKKPIIRYAGGWVNNIVELVYVLLHFKIRKSISDKVDALLFSHDTSVYNWLGIDYISKYTKCNCKIVRPNGTVEQDINFLKIRSIPWTNIVSFYRHLVSGLCEFYWSSHISIGLYTYLLYNWKDLYYLRCLYKECNIQIILSGYESDLSQQAVAVASDSRNMISLDCVWSIGNLPSESLITAHKYSDRFFIWGMWHYYLMEASMNKSSGYVIAGYVGDHYISKMRIKGGALRNKYSGLFEKFITVYDAPATKDSVYSNTTITEYIKAVMSIANEFNALVILKVKRMSALHTDLLKLYGYNRLVIDCEHGSISSAMISDAVVGLSNSTPASIAAVHGRNVITYNPSNNVWSRWESLHHPYLMVGELSDLKMALSKLLLNGKSQSTFSTISIDPYGDGKAQYRIARYMQDIFKHLSFGKKFSLHHADNEYRRLWGNDKVLTRL